MKVHNLTDVPTSALEQRGHINHSIAVGAQLIGPGKSAEVEDGLLKTLEEGLRPLVSCGALAIGDLPPEYKAAKDAKAPPAPAIEAAPMTEEKVEERPRNQRR